MEERQIHTSGVDSTIYWLAQPGDRVVTVDGPGTVSQVFDGPYPDTEEYHVLLDDERGGGEYARREILALITDRTARRYSGVPMACDRCGTPAMVSRGGGKGGHRMLCRDCADQEDAGKDLGEQRQAVRTATRMSPLLPEGVTSLSSSVPVVPSSHGPEAGRDGRGRDAVGGRARLDRGGAFDAPGADRDGVRGVLRGLTAARPRQEPTTPKTPPYYTATVTQAAKADARALDPVDRSKVMSALKRFLRTGQGDVHKLNDVKPPTYRMRIGDIRVIFENSGGRHIVIIRIGYRGQLQNYGREGARRTAARNPLPLLTEEDAQKLGWAIASNDYPELGTILWDRPDHVEAEPATGMGRRITIGSLRTAKPIEPTWLKGGPKSKSNPIKDSLDDKNQPWWWRKLVGPAVDRVNDSLPPGRRAETADDMRRIPHKDWCRFRRNDDCWFPREMDQEASAEAGYAVWVPFNRGECPWKTREAQKNSCRVSEPGPNSGEAETYPDATRSWGQGGQRQGSLSVTPVAIERTAKWVDVRNKAKRIRQEGGVRIIAVAGDTITGEIKGDTGLYTATITLVPGTNQVGLATCSCPWETYRWLRSGPWKKYEGRACAHITALLFEMQSRKMFGGEVTEDAATPEWRTEQPALEPERSRPGDWRTDRAALLSAAVEAHLVAVAGRVADLDARAALQPDLDAQVASLALAEAALRGGVDDRDDRSLTPIASILTGAKWNGIEYAARELIDPSRIVEHVTAENGDRLVIWYHPRERAIYLDPEIGVLGRHMGVLMWFHHGEILTVQIDPAYRREGFASRMFEIAKQFEPNLHHSHELTEDGQAWSKSVGASLAWTDNSIGDPNGEWYASVGRPGNADGKWQYRIDTPYGPMIDGGFATAEEAMAAAESAMDPETVQGLGQVTAAVTTIEIPAEVQTVIDEGDFTHAGLVIKSLDSGRVLMTQRTPFHGDDEATYGTWEFPGGGLEPGEDAVQGALREFSEETGLALPEHAQIRQAVPSKNYVSIIVCVPHESWTTEVELLPAETMGIGWFDPEFLDGAPITRPEVQNSDWDLVKEAAKGDGVDACKFCGSSSMFSGFFNASGDAEDSDAGGALWDTVCSDCGKFQVRRNQASPDDVRYEACPVCNANVRMRLVGRSWKRGAHTNLQVGGVCAGSEVRPRSGSVSMDWDAVKEALRTVAVSDRYGYHLTSKIDFKLDPKKRPENNTTLGGSFGPGIFLADPAGVEYWCNGYGYWRPWVVEIDTAGAEPKFSGGYGGHESFFPADQFSKMRIVRVIPLDAFCREMYGAWGWTEDDLGKTFDTNEPIDTSVSEGASWDSVYPWRGWTYSGDARNESSEWQQAYAKRVRSFARTRPHAIASVQASGAERVIEAAQAGPFTLTPGTDRQNIIFDGERIGWLYKSPLDKLWYVRISGLYSGNNRIYYKPNDIVVNGEATRKDALESLERWLGRNESYVYFLRQQRESDGFSFDAARGSTVVAVVRLVTGNFGELLSCGHQGQIVSHRSAEQLDLSLKTGATIERPCSICTARTEDVAWSGPSQPAIDLAQQYIDEGTGATAILHDEPEPALPVALGEALAAIGDGIGDPDQFPGSPLVPSSTDGRTGPDDPWRVDPAQAEDRSADAPFTPGDPRLSHLLGESDPAADTADIAQAAQAFLAKTALRDFSAYEQQALISEGEMTGTGARNLDDRLDIAGTHYELLEAQASEEYDDTDWMG